MGIGSCFYFSEQENKEDEIFKLLEEINDAKEYIVKCILYTEYQITELEKKTNATFIRKKMEMKKLLQKKEGMKKAQTSYEAMHNSIITQRENENLFTTMKQTRKFLKAQQSQFNDYTTFGNYYEIEYEIEKPNNKCDEAINVTLNSIENLPACPKTIPNLDFKKSVPILNG